jgi:CHAD domain-containing protein
LFGGGKKRKAALADALETFQDALGRLNDFSVHRNMAEEVVGKRPAKRPQKAFAMGIVTGQEQAKIKSCLIAARKAGMRLQAQRPFW